MPIKKTTNVPRNTHCSGCGRSESEPAWAHVNFDVFLCTICAVKVGEIAGMAATETVEALVRDVEDAKAETESLRPLVRAAEVVAVAARLIGAVEEFQTAAVDLSALGAAARQAAGEGIGGL